MADHHHHHHHHPPPPRRGGGGTWMESPFSDPGRMGSIDPMDLLKEQFDREPFFSGGGGNSSPPHNGSMRYQRSDSPSEDFMRVPRRSFPNYHHPGFDLPRGFGEESNPHSIHLSSSPRRVSGVESIPIKVIHEKSPHVKRPFTGYRNTTEIPTTSAHNSNNQESPRLERAHSEPPKTFNQRLSRVNPPQSIPEKTDEDHNNPITTSASAPTVSAGHSPPPQSSSSFEEQQPSRAQQPAVRHIPIVVEGRDAPVYSRKFSDTAPYRKPSDYYPPGTKKEPTKRTPEPTTPQGPPPGPIPMGCSSQHLHPPEEQEPKSQHQPPPEGPIPLPNLSKEEEVNPRDSVDASQTEEKKDPALVKVQSIKNDLADITRRIEEFKGNKKNKEYLYLDEMLTRHLLSLDCIDSGGKEEIRKIRKESIKSVNRCLSLLDSKAKQNPDAETNNQILSDLAQISDEQNNEENKK